MFLQHLAFNPLPNKEAKPTVTATEEHVAWLSWSSKSLRQFIRKIGKRRQEAAFAVEVVGAVQLNRLVIFQHIDEDKGRSNQDKFIRCHIPYMENRLVQRLLPFDYFVLGGAVVDPKPEAN